MPVRHEVSVDGAKILAINGDLGNANTSYFYFNVGRDNYKHWTLQFTIQATTISIQATNDTEAVTDANAVWTDITTALFGVASETVTGAWIVDSPNVFGRYRITRLTTNATNALTVRLARGT